MAVDERSRKAPHDALERRLGPEEAATLMELLPPVGWADVATKDDLRQLELRLRAEMQAMGSELRGEFAELRGEMGALGSELRGEMASLRSELHGEMGALGSELRGEMASLKAELGGEIAGLRGEMGALRAELRGEVAELRGEMGALREGLSAAIDRGMRRTTQWLVGVLLGGMAVMTAVLRLL